MKIGFFDIDGTLLKANHRAPSPAVCQRLRDLQQNIHVCFCSGRSQQELNEIINYVGLEPTIHIFGNGSYVLEKDNSVTALSKTANTVWAPLLDLLRARNLRFYALQANGWTTNFDEKPASCFLIESGPLESTESLRAELDKLLFMHNITFVIVPNERVNSQFYLLSESATANKGSGIHYVLKKLGISKEFAFAIGDSENDLSMRERVGKFYVMNNGAHLSQKLTAFADKILPAVDVDGVLTGIEDVLSRLPTKNVTP